MKLWGENVKVRKDERQKRAVRLEGRRDHWKSTNESSAEGIKLETTGEFNQ